MASVAKVFGFLCMFGAVFEVVLAAVLLWTVDGGSTGGDSGTDVDFGPTFGGFAVLLLGVPVLAFLLLFTVGVAAYVVGEMAERELEERRRQGALQADRGYGASART